MALDSAAILGEDISPGTSSPKMVSAAGVIARTPSCPQDTEGKCSSISRNTVLYSMDGPDNSARCSLLKGLLRESLNAIISLGSTSIKIKD